MSRHTALHRRFRREPAQEPASCRTIDCDEPEPREHRGLIDGLGPFPSQPGPLSHARSRGVFRSPRQPKLDAFLPRKSTTCAASGLLRPAATTYGGSNQVAPQLLPPCGALVKGCRIEMQSYSRSVRAGPSYSPHGVLRVPRLRRRNRAIFRATTCYESEILELRPRLKSRSGFRCFISAPPVSPP